MSSKLGPTGPRAFEAILHNVSHGAAIFAASLAPLFGGRRGEFSAAIPWLASERGPRISTDTLVLETRAGIVQVPWPKEGRIGARVKK